MDIEKAGAIDCRSVFCYPNNGIDIGITIGYIKGMKTAISIPDNIFREVDIFAKQHHYSRSEVFVRAVKELLEKKSAAELLKTLNKAYADAETPEYRDARKFNNHLSIRMLKKEKY